MTHIVECTTVHTHREMNICILLTETKFDCNYTSPIDSAPYGIPFGAQVIGEVK